MDDADRRARLAAIASGGIQGANAYDDAQKQVQGRKVAAIDSMTADAGRLGGGQPNVTAALDQMVGDPYDSASGVLGDASSSYGQQLATMAAGTSLPVATVAAAAPGTGPWGGYANETSYVNAVKGKAEIAKDAEAQTQADQMQTASDQQTQTAAQQFADQYAAQQKALTIAPGTVIHGPGYVEPNTWISPPETPSGEAGVAAQVAAREMIRRGAPTAPAPTGSTYDPAAAARAGDEGARIGLSNPGQVQSIEQPYLKALDALASPLNDYQYERRAALSLGADRDATFGRFAPPTDADKLAAMQDQERLDNYIRSGYATPTEAKSADEAQAYLDATKAGVPADDLRKVSTTLGVPRGQVPDLLTGLASDSGTDPGTVASMVVDRRWGSIRDIANANPKFGDFSSKLNSLNDSAPDSDKLSPEQVNVALAYYRRLLGN